MATGGRTDPLAGYHFYVEITGAGIVGAFRECSGLGSESQVIEYRSADKAGETRVHKVPGTTKWTDITLKRGLTDSMSLWQWRKKVEDGQVDAARTNGSIVLFNQQNGEVARWNFKEAWPSKVSGPSLNAGNNEVAIEEMTITHEGIERAK
jgi:phage tail-like protein